MAFALSHAALVHDTCEKINTLRSRFLGTEPPAKLFHYTNRDAVIGIAGSRTVRATCVVCLDDTTEVMHGIKAVETEVHSVLRYTVHPLARMVLKRLGEQMGTRISRIFVACFCSNRNSLRYWRLPWLSRHGYGDYCLEFATNKMREPLLRPTPFRGASVQYNRVIYGAKRQRKAIRTALQDIAAAISHNSSGQLDGPWATSVLDLVIRDTAELLLDLIVSFKRRRYILDQEWRLIIRPGEVVGSSAPAVTDSNFDLIVKREVRGNKSKRYVEVFLPRQTFPPLLSSMSPIPFTAVYQSPFSKSSADFQAIRLTLNENGGADIPIRPSRFRIA
jgi:hypothetical protein